MIVGLTREVAEETGLLVTEWEGPLWQTSAISEAFGFTLEVDVSRCRVRGLARPRSPGRHRRLRVVRPMAGVADLIAATWRPTTEPLLAWLAERWSERRAYAYKVEGPDRTRMTVELL